MPFRATSARFEHSKTDDSPTIGTYYVTEDFGRQIKPWRRAPQWMKDKKRNLFFIILKSLLKFIGISQVPFRSELMEQKEGKRYNRHLDYFNLYF